MISEIKQKIQSLPKDRIQTLIQGSWQEIAEEFGCKTRRESEKMRTFLGKFL